MEESISKRILSSIPNCEYKEEIINRNEDQEICEYRLELKSNNQTFKHRLMFTGVESRLRLRADDGYEISEAEKDTVREQFIVKIITAEMLA